MALIKFGTIVTEGHGSLGGHTFQNSSGGAQLKTKSYKKHQSSSAQYQIRSVHRTILDLWKSISPAERNLWNSFPDKSISGQQLYLKFQFVYLINNLPAIHSPYDYKPEPLGPELIKNNTFVGSSFWTLRAGYTCPDIGLYINAAPGAFINQVVHQSTGKIYRFLIVCNNISTGYFRIYSGNAQGNITVRGGGTFFSIFTRTAYPDNNVYIQNVPATIGKINSISLREIL
jgi:hypothetical protein